MLRGVISSSSTFASCAELSGCGDADELYADMIDSTSIVSLRVRRRRRSYREGRYMRFLSIYLVLGGAKRYLRFIYSWTTGMGRYAMSWCGNLDLGNEDVLMCGWAILVFRSRVPTSGAGGRLRTYCLLSLAMRYDTIAWHFPFESGGAGQAEGGRRKASLLEELISWIFGYLDTWIPR